MMMAVCACVQCAFLLNSSHFQKAHTCESARHRLRRSTSSSSQRTTKSTNKQDQTKYSTRFSSPSALSSCQPLSTTSLSLFFHFKKNYTFHIQDMMLISLLTVVLASFTGTTSAQNIVYDSTHNVTPLHGTWSSGSKAVLTGSVSPLEYLEFDVFCLTSFAQGFADPANLSFTYPPTTGISYSLSVFSLFLILVLSV